MPKLINAVKRDFHTELLLSKQFHLKLFQTLNQTDKVLHQDLFDDVIWLKRQHSEKFEVRLKLRLSHVFTML